jgi:hypothetical protein
MKYLSLLKLKFKAFLFLLWSARISISKLEFFSLYGSLEKFRENTLEFISKNNFYNKLFKSPFIKEVSLKNENCLENSFIFKSSNTKKFEFFEKEFSYKK